MASHSGAFEPSPEAQQELDQARKDALDVPPRAPISYVSREEMHDAHVPREWRDNCAHVLIPLNRCREQEFSLPWKCVTLRNAYEKCHHNECDLRAHGAVRAPLTSAPSPAPSAMCAAAGLRPWRAVPRWSEARACTKQQCSLSGSLRVIDCVRVSQIYLCTRNPAATSVYATISNRPWSQFVCPCVVMMVTRTHVAKKLAVS